MHIVFYRYIGIYVYVSDSVQLYIQIEENRSVIKKKHQPYKKQLRRRRRKKWAKFKELHEYSKSVRAAKLNIARKKKLELPKREHFMLQVRNEAMNENGTKEKESNSSYKGQQKQSAPGRPVISNCRIPTEKASEFLDYHVKPVMQRIWSYIKDSGDFIEKIKRIPDIPDDV